MQNPITNTIQEISIMTDNNNAALKRDKRFFQNTQSGQIKIVVGSSRSKKLPPFFISLQVSDGFFHRPKVSDQCVDSII